MKFLAFFIGVVHVLTGPDHTLPIVAVARHRKWGLSKTLAVTLVGAVFHLGLAVVLALFVQNIEQLGMFETLRGHLVSWFLVITGIVLIGTFYRQRTRDHFSRWGDRLWLSLVWMGLLLGPCEPLIPFLSYPGMTGEQMFALFASFSAATVFTMLCVVALLHQGLKRFVSLEFKPALVGAVFLVSGILSFWF